MCPRPRKPGRRGCDGSPCLFDLASDPCEHHDLSKQRPGVTTKLHKRLDQYQADMVPARNKPVDVRANPKYWNYAWVNWGDKVEPPLP